jgi:hypothetical protein
MLRPVESLGECMLLYFKDNGRLFFIAYDGKRRPQPVKLSGKLSFKTVFSAINQGRLFVEED